MHLRELRYLLSLFVVTAAIASPVHAQLISKHGNVADKFNALFPVDHTRPMTVTELCYRLDCLAEEMRDDGLIVLKQPDVFSQARMTRFRNDFENQMSSDLANFHLVLAARISRLDSATTTQTTSLGAALAAPGTTNVTAPSQSATDILGTENKLFNGAGSTSLFGQQIDPNKGTFGNLTLASNNFAPLTSNSGAAASALGLGVDPTVYLDEKKRFLEHLNEIRRINLGPDQNDSSGYGLYLVRMPVSITPGECTYNGHGADLALRVEHEFTPDFLPSTFKNLIVNDVVDQLGPLIYELIRSGGFDKLKTKIDLRYKRNALRVENAKLLESQREYLAKLLLKQVADETAKAAAEALRHPETASTPVTISCEGISKSLTDYILRARFPLTGDPEKDGPNWDWIANRLTDLNDFYAKTTTGLSDYDARIPQDSAEFKHKINLVRRGALHTANFSDDVRRIVEIVLFGILRTGVPLQQRANLFDRTIYDRAKIPDKNFAEFAGKLEAFVKALYQSALSDDVGRLDEALKLDTKARQITAKTATNNDEILRTVSDRSVNKISLPSVRSAKQFYPIAPRELLDFFLEENIYILAKDINEASRAQTVRATEVRSYLRQTLETAYSAMAYPTRRAPEVLPILADQQFMLDLRTAIYQRHFGTAEGDEDDEDDSESVPGEGYPDLRKGYKYMIKQLECSRDNIRGKPIGALCWALAVDAAILDSAFRVDARKVFTEKGLPCDQLDSVHFYIPKEIPNDAAKEIFAEYVKLRWPILTFALDPVTDQQNIADSFNLKRDLQLALSFAFATGQINFSQLSTFQRKIEQSSDTIALNRTITGFTHDHDIFGFRFTPRFQNPPAQRTNIGVIASQLIGGGPGPDYQTRKSKLEAGMRELTAVLLIPTFLPTMRMDITGNWFKLNDPEHLIFHTSRMMERGRRVQELRQCVDLVIDSHAYRDADVRVLKTKLAQLEAMLPMQSRVIQLPFENSANGFDLFSEGATALVPELTGYSGVDVINGNAANAAANATFTTTTLTTPATTTNFAIGGGTTSIADVFIIGKYISLLDTRVIAGGRSASFEILSREVIHVQIPSSVIATTTYDNKTYIEIYVSTPNGISNSLLVPYHTAHHDPAEPGSSLRRLAWQPECRHLLPMAQSGRRNNVARPDGGSGRQGSDRHHLEIEHGPRPAANSGAVHRSDRQPESPDQLAGDCGKQRRLQRRRQGVCRHGLEATPGYCDARKRCRLAKFHSA